MALAAGRPEGPEAVDYRDGAARSPGGARHAMWRNTAGVL